MKNASFNLSCRAKSWAAALLLLLLAAPAAMAQTTLTVAEGKVLLLRGTGTFILAAGARLDTGDMLATEAKGQAQIEFTDGLMLNLGPDSKLYLQEVSGAAGKPVDVALAVGWLKVALPAGAKPDARSLRATLPGLTVESSDATLVLHASAGLDELFVEGGTVKTSEVARDGSVGKSLVAKGSDYAARKEGQAPALARPPQTFLGALPRHFTDKLPVQLAKLKDAKREPVRDHDTTYAEAEAWLRANAIVRTGLVARYQPLLKDPQFKSGLAANIADLPDWERLLGAAKKK